MDYEDENLNAFWLSYRRSARYRQEEVGKYGLSVLSGNTGNPENFLIDINVNTPGDFSDAFLLLGHTFSDYDSDVHITPFRHGGIHPMEYLEVVVKGTVESGLSSAPEFSVEVSNQFPAIESIYKLPPRFWTTMHPTMPILGLPMRQWRQTLNFLTSLPF